MALANRRGGAVKTWRAPPNENDTRVPEPENGVRRRAAR